MAAIASAAGLNTLRPTRWRRHPSRYSLHRSTLSAEPPLCAGLSLRNARR